MIDKERLLAVPGLQLAGEIEKMDEERLNLYIQELNSFVEYFQEQESAFKAALEGKDYDLLSYALSVLSDTLKEIHAYDLADQSLEQIEGLNGASHEKIEAGVTSFLTSLAALSIDIQMMVYKKAAPALSDGSTAANDGQAGQGPVEILAVDDAPIFLNTLKSMIQGTGYQLTCVTSGRDALRFLSSHTPQLIILDIEMPKMNGYELAKKIRESGQKAPIVFLTGNSKRQHVINAVEAGGIDFVVKPINQKDLLARIRKHI
jgi:CheY-like chemotaxis protein